MINGVNTLLSQISKTKIGNIYLFFLCFQNSSQFKTKGKIATDRHMQK